MEQLTLAELADRAGLSEDATRERLRALGLPVPAEDDKREFGAEEIEAVARGQQLRDPGLTRFMAGAIARVADTVSEAYGDDADELIPLAAADFEYLLRRQLRTLEAVPEGDEVAVAFADIVGFTELGEQLPETELTEIAERLEALAAEHSAEPVRLVKTIGDAVMLVSRDTAALVKAITALTEAAKDDLPPLRTGIAYGRAAARLGDFYGPAVNLASRLTSRARPESILVTNGVRDALGDATDGYSFSEAGLKRFKGIGDPVATLRLRRAAADG